MLMHCLAKAISGMGCDVNVITLTSRYRTDWLRLSTIATEEQRRYAYEGIPVSQIGFSRGTRLLLLPWALSYYALMKPAVKAISRYMLPFFESLPCHPSLVHATRNGREFLTRASLDFAHKHGIPFALTPCHHPRWKGFLYREYDRIYREADAVFALTAAEKQALVTEKGVREERVHVTGVGPILSANASPEKFRETYGIKGRFVLYLAQQLKYKGIAAILEAAPIVWNKHPDTQFVFVGPETTYSKRLFRDVRDKRIRNLGLTDLDTKTCALAACDFLCVPSFQESFGIAYVEAWSLRKAVIGGRIPPIANVITDGKDGLLSSQDPSELASMICFLLSNPEACRSMGDAGHQKVEGKYTWDHMARKTLAVYQALCS